MGIGITGIPGNSRPSRDFHGDENSRGDGTYFTGFPDYRMVHVHHKSESNIHFFHVQNFRCMLNYNDNAN